VHIAGSAATCTYCQLTRQLCFRTCGKSSGLFMPVMDPFQFFTLTYLVCDTVERITYYAVYSFYPGGYQLFYYLSSYCFGHKQGICELNVLFQINELGRLPGISLIPA
jgi:hypothetical protein